MVRLPGSIIKYRSVLRGVQVELDGLARMVQADVVKATGAAEWAVVPHIGFTPLGACTPIVRQAEAWFVPGRHRAADCIHCKCLAASPSCLAAECAICGGSLSQHLCS